MLITPQKDGSLIVEELGLDFTRDWKAAAMGDRVVLDDGRPAVRRGAHSYTEKPTYLTIPMFLWERIQWLKKSGKLGNIPSRTKQCGACHSEMKMVRELDEVWCFRCRHCGSNETWGKNVVGGTRGQGEKEKV